MDGSTSEISPCSIERLWINGERVGSGTIYGIVGYGDVHGLSVFGCGIVTLAGAGTKGIYLQSTGTVEPSGCYLERILVQNVWGTGIGGAFGDSTLHTCHVQRSRHRRLTLRAGDRMMTL